MPEKCALSHGSGVLGRDPRDSCRFWSPHVENVCTVTQIRLGEGGGGGIPFGGGGGGRRTENRDHIHHPLRDLRVPLRDLGVPLRDLRVPLRDLRVRLTQRVHIHYHHGIRS